MSKIFLNLITIEDALNKIETYSSPFSTADDFYHHELNFDASMMQFVIIGEAVSRIDEDFKQSHPITSQWQLIKNFRNLIAHNYFGIDAEEVWDIIKNHLPTLKKEIALLIKESPQT